MAESEEADFEKSLEEVVGSGARGESKNILSYANPRDVPKKRVKFSKIFAVMVLGTGLVCLIAKAAGLSEDLQIIAGLGVPIGSAAYLVARCFEDREMRVREKILAALAALFALGGAIYVGAAASGAGVTPIEFITDISYFVRQAKTMFRRDLWDLEWALEVIVTCVVVFAGVRCRVWYRRRGEESRRMVNDVASNPV